MREVGRGEGGGDLGHGSLGSDGLGLGLKVGRELGVSKDGNPKCIFFERGPFNALNHMSVYTGYKKGPCLPWGTYGAGLGTEGRQRGRRSELALFHILLYQPKVFYLRS